ncbi:Multiple resistance and pH homeostasis protein G [Marinibacterium anthonyi]|nr:Multiple resistance and pH homeostasis protein G [Marinibacterium anthonyi]
MTGAEIMTPDLAPWAEILISAFLVIGGLFALVGSFGLVKLDNTLQRLHAPTKATTLGVGGVLVGSIAYFYLVEGKVTFHELLITLFLFLTAPITANFIAKTYMCRCMEESDLPQATGPYGWSLYDDPPGSPEDVDSAATD